MRGHQCRLQPPRKDSAAHGLPLPPLVQEQGGGGRGAHHQRTSKVSVALGGMVPRTPEVPYAIWGGMVSFRLSPTRIPSAFPGRRREFIQAWILSLNEAPQHIDAQTSAEQQPNRRSLPLATQP